MWFADRFFAWEPEVKRARKAGESTGSLSCLDVGKAYGETQVLQHYSAVYKPGEISCLTWPCGAGKTTLLRLLAGLERPDSGSVQSPGVCSMVFQEDRLCMEYSALKNVELVTGDRERSRKALLEFLEKEEIERPCDQLSGGRKRLVALVRAMEAESDFVLLDEPFADMDSGTRKLAEEYIARRQRGRTVLIAARL